ncbi:ABC transporter permease [Parvularcula sp. IMCC14364]|uniref:ABC transporter permease n=1 Tax=Parvularcula sp. IMCC14364 TaxID=3067902 RepID=UPI0027427555|nr:ABC transporter permease [Parvularcula sp. IMCC14364]
MTTENSTTATPHATAFGTRRFGAVNWLGLWTLYQKEVRRFTKVAFQTIFAPIISTLLFLLVFMGAWGARGTGIVMENLATGDLVEFAVTVFLPPGLIMMAIISNAFQNSSSTLIIAKVQGSIVDILMPPLSAAELMIAIVAGAATRGLLVGFVTALTVTAFTWGDVQPLQHLWAVLYFSAMAAILMGMIGAIAGMWAEKFDQLALISNFVITPLTFLSGTFYSMRSAWLPDFVLLFSQVNPVFYLIDGFRYGFIGVSDASPLTGALVILGLNIVTGGITYYLFKTGYKLKA